MNPDEIQLTLPADDAFHRVAHLVLGGLATRHDLTVESLEDLSLALDTLLDRYGDSVDEVTVRIAIVDDHVRIGVGPFDDPYVRTELEQSTPDALDIRRILAAVCDDVRVADRDGGTWVELAKQIERTHGAAA